MEGERAEVVRDLRELARKMRDVADAMWRLHMGVNVDDHAVQMTGAAAIADGWVLGDVALETLTDQGVRRYSMRQTDLLKLRLADVTGVTPQK